MENAHINPVPSLRNMLLLRRLSNNQENESYIFFCENYLKSVVGLQAFNRKWNYCLKLSEVATASDEALGLLLLENSEYRWQQEYEIREKGGDLNKASLAKTKYTSVGQQKDQKKGFTKRFGGWREEGIKQFNALFDMVKEDRMKNGAWFDEIMKRRSQMKGGAIQETLVDHPGGWTKASNDLFDDCEEDEDEEESAAPLDHYLPLDDLLHAANQETDDLNHEEV